MSGCYTPAVWIVFYTHLLSPSIEKLLVSFTSSTLKLSVLIRTAMNIVFQRIVRGCNNSGPRKPVCIKEGATSVMWPFPMRHNMHARDTLYLRCLSILVPWTHMFIVQGRSSQPKGSHLVGGAFWTLTVVQIRRPKWKWRPLSGVFFPMQKCTPDIRDDGSASFPDLDFSLDNEDAAPGNVDLVRVVAFHTFLILGPGKFANFLQKKRNTKKKLWEESPKIVTVDGPICIQCSDMSQ